MFIGGGTLQNITLHLGGRKRITLKQDELYILKEIFIHRIMRSSDIHELYHQLLKRPIHSKSISRKLTRLNDVGILRRMEEPFDHKRPSVKSYYYKLGRRGLIALSQNGFINSNDVDSLNKHFLTLKIPKAHNLALSSLVNTIRIKSVKRNLEYDHYRGSTWVEGLNEELLFMPDWIFEQENRKIFIEIDTGTEPLAMIDGKVKKYIEYSQSNADEIIVVFSIMDSSVNRLITSDRSKRIASLKQSMPPYQDWPSNLSIYVLSAERTPNLVLRLLDGLEPLDQQYRGYVIDEWIEKWKSKSTFTQYLIENSVVYGKQRIPELESDKVVRLDERLKTRYISFLYGEEGSVKTFQQIRYNHNLSTGSIISGLKVDDVIVIYFDQDALLHDIHGIHNWNNAWFTQRSIWKIKGADGEYPFMLKAVSPYRKEWVPFE